MRAHYYLLLTAQAMLSVLLGQSTNWTTAGNRALYAGRSAEAAEDYRRALDEQVRAGTPDAALLHLRVSLVTADIDAGDLHGAEAMLQQLDAAGARNGDPRSRAEVLNVRAALHFRQGKWNETERELEEARDLMLHAPKPGDLLASVLHNLASIQLRTGAYAEALSNEQEAMSLWEKVIVPDHPHMIKAWATLGAVQYLLGCPYEAHRSMEHAIASARKTYGPSHPLLADVLDSDAVVLDRLKQKREAKLARAEARHMRGDQPAPRTERTTWNVREALGPDSPVYLR